MNTSLTPGETLLPPGENFFYSYRERAKSPSIEAHFHNCYEILLFKKGDAEYHVEGKVYELTAGDILITNPRELHCPIFKSNREYIRSLVFIRASYLSEFITRDYNPFDCLEKRKIGSQNKIPADIVKKYELDKKMDYIGKYYASDLPEKEIMIKSYLLQMLVHINSIISSETKLGSNRKIDDIILYINENICENLTLDDLADKFYLNKYYLSHEFKAKTGFSTMEYITHKRIMMAKEYLLENIHPSQAAEMVGFSEYSSFYRAFTRVMGVPPSKMKKEMS